MLYAQPRTSTFARDSMTCGVRLYSSSNNAARKVPGPLTSFRAAATSAAMVNTNTLRASAREILPAASIDWAYLPRQCSNQHVAVSELGSLFKRLFRGEVVQFSRGAKCSDKSPGHTARTSNSAKLRLDQLGALFGQARGQTKG